jgi:hypothetical protein
MFRKEMKATAGTAIYRNWVGTPVNQINPKNRRPAPTTYTGKTFRFKAASLFIQKNSAAPAPRAIHNTKNAGKVLS